MSDIVEKDQLVAASENSANLLGDFLLEHAGANQHRFVAFQERLRTEDWPAVQRLPVIARVRLDEGRDVGLGESAGGQQATGVRADAPHDDGPSGIDHGIDSSAKRL